MTQIIHTHFFRMLKKTINNNNIIDIKMFRDIIIINGHENLSLL